VGTRLDQITLLGDGAKADELEREIARALGFSRVLETPGQVYPRLLDFQALSVLYGVSAALADFSTAVRLMTGQELASEGFGPGQVGSSAMPHKMNARNCERIHGLHVVLGGFLEMTSRLAGDQWNEGDVACSVVRRVALPSACFALDGALETFLTVLEEMEVYEAALSAEVRRYLPFLATTTLLMEAVKAAGGEGRERLHGVVREHALAVARGLREGRLSENDLAERLDADPRFPLRRGEIQAVLADPLRFLGDAPAQVERFLRRVAEVRAAHPEAAAYRPEPIL
jgi:adenylosuccinate lyase